MAPFDRGLSDERKAVGWMKSGLVIVGRGFVFFLFEDTRHSVIKVMYSSYLAYFFFSSTKSSRLDMIVATCRSRYGSSGQISILNSHTRWVIEMQTEVRYCDAMVRVSGASTTNRSTARINIIAET